MLELANTLVLFPTFGIQIEPKTLFLFFHIVCFALGIGAATLLNILVIRTFLFNRVIEDGDFGIISFASKVVALGLLLSWISGGLYLNHVYATNPQILENPKFLVKVCVLCVLTLNGVFIHSAVIPHIKRKVHSTMFEETPMWKRLVFLMSGSVSVVSWYFPVLLGTAKEMNVTMPFHQIFSFYLTLAVLALLLICGAKLAVLLWTERAHMIGRLKATCAPLALRLHGEPRGHLLLAHSEPYLRMPSRDGDELAARVIALTCRVWRQGQSKRPYPHALLPPVDFLCRAQG